MVSLTITTSLCFKKKSWCYSSWCLWSLIKDSGFNPSNMCYITAPSQWVMNRQRSLSQEDVQTVSLDISKWRVRFLSLESLGMKRTGRKKNQRSRSAMVLSYDGVVSWPVSDSISNVLMLLNIHRSAVFITCFSDNSINFTWPLVGFDNNTITTSLTETSPKKAYHVSPLSVDGKSRTLSTIKEVQQSYTTIISVVTNLILWFSCSFWITNSVCAGT